MPVVSCMLHGACCAMLVARCLLHVVCCTLSAARCLSATSPVRGTQLSTCSCTKLSHSELARRYGCADTRSLTCRPSAACRATRHAAMARPRATRQWRGPSARSESPADRGGTHLTRSHADNRARRARPSSFAPPAGRLRAARSAQRSVGCRLHVASRCIATRTVTLICDPSKLAKDWPSPDAPAWIKIVASCARCNIAALPRCRFATCRVASLHDAACKKQRAASVRAVL